MRNLLYLVHRLPYPPNKGDKVRSYNLLKYLCSQYNVFLGTFVDDPDDLIYVNLVRGLCFDSYIENLNPTYSKFRSLSGLVGDGSLSVAYYRSEGLKKWVSRVLANHDIDVAVVFSSVMAQYVLDIPNLKFLVDFVDVDSAKWSEYALRHKWPMSWLYGREGRNLLKFETEVANKAVHSFFVTQNELDLFNDLSPDSSKNISALNNGVDFDYFSPVSGRMSPFPMGSKFESNFSIVFTGAMDYWPNIDAVLWFASEILPALRNKYPNLVFYVVGRSPSEDVLNLTSGSIVVTGTVPDVRPYLQHASVIVAPLRIARGIQNKILEAMAMERAVVASQICVQAIDAQPEQEILTAKNADDFIFKISSLLDEPAMANKIGLAGRRRVTESYSWTAHLAGIDRHLECPEVQ
ncbi:TIGR03087 family PEP-CTERM/XrtA system glycosyltransferase [Rhodoferax sp.]|uniref:TIGR03087 family PEP-CTERM/XrtA system glycosyltransferase n=1 Tax=Rhodoferax sp. TaxID=50421 RepID=UPI00374DA1F5